VLYQCIKRPPHCCHGGISRFRPWSQVASASYPWTCFCSSSPNTFQRLFLICPFETLAVLLEHDTRAHPPIRSRSTSHTLLQSTQTNLGTPDRKHELPPAHTIRCSGRGQVASGAFACHASSSCQSTLETRDYRFRDAPRRPRHAK
jgi:hypothetical protein